MMSRTASLFTRIVSVCFISCILAFAGAALYACGPDHEQAIRDSLTQELDSIKNLDESFVSDLESASGVSDLEEFGIDPKEFFTSYLSGFDYTIDEVAVDGETASATVTLTAKSYTEFNDAIQSNLDALVSDDSLYTLSEEEVYSRIGQTVMDTIDGLSPVQTAPITISYELIDNTWTPTEESQAAIDEALMAS